MYIYLSNILSTKVQEEGKPRFRTLPRRSWSGILAASSVKCCCSWECNWAVVVDWLSPCARLYSCLRWPPPAEPLEERGQKRKIFAYWARLRLETGSQNDLNSSLSVDCIACIWANFVLVLWLFHVQKFKSCPMVLSRGYHLMDATIQWHYVSFYCNKGVTCYHQHISVILLHGYNYFNKNKVE